MSSHGWQCGLRSRERAINSHPPFQRDSAVITPKSAAKVELLFPLSGFTLKESPVSENHSRAGYLRAGTVIFHLKE
jgi:hypothetical protein